jgi:hypothetical protein
VPGVVGRHELFQDALVRAAIALAAGLVLVLAGCSAAKDDPTIATSNRVSMSAAPTSAPARSAGVASRAAAQLELAAFNRVNGRTVLRNHAADGSAFIDGLVTAGFRRGTMEVTEDRTTIGLRAPSVQFSVLWRGVCLIGQYGPESGGYHAVATAPLAGRCLVGKTRTIGR